MIEFDSDGVPEESAMIWYIEEGLKLLLRVEIEQRSREPDNFNEIVEKAVDTKAKAGLSLRSYTCKTNQHYGQSNQSAVTKSYA